MGFRLLVALASRRLFPSIRHGTKKPAGRQRY